jgi:hypothetical protein
MSDFDLLDKYQALQNDEYYKRYFVRLSNLQSEIGVKPRDVYDRCKKTFLDTNLTSQEVVDFFNEWLVNANIRLIKKARPEAILNMIVKYIRSYLTSVRTQRHKTAVERGTEKNHIIEYEKQEMEGNYNTNRHANAKDYIDRKNGVY